MKRLVLFLIFGMLAVSYTYSQTYYYKEVEIVDKNGAKTKGSGGAYITFTNGKRCCYVSDKNGYKKIYDVQALSITERLLCVNQIDMITGSFNYVETKNGYLFYDNRYVADYIVAKTPIPATKGLYVYSDYSKFALVGYDSQYIFERTDGPYDDSIPIF